MLVYRNEHGTKFLDKRMLFLSEMVFYHGLENQITELEDWKGTLMIKWNKQPDRYDMEILVLCWKFLQEYSTQHYFEDKLIYETN